MVESYPAISEKAVEKDGKKNQVAYMMITRLSK